MHEGAWGFEGGQRYHKQLAQAAPPRPVDPAAEQPPGGARGASPTAELTHRARWRRRCGRSSCPSSSLPQRPQPPLRQPPQHPAAGWPTRTTTCAPAPPGPFAPGPASAQQPPAYPPALFPSAPWLTAASTPHGPSRALAGAAPHPGARWRQPHAAGLLRSLQGHRRLRLRRLRQPLREPAVRVLAQVRPRHQECTRLQVRRHDMLPRGRGLPAGHPGRRHVRVRLPPAPGGLRLVQRDGARRPQRRTGALAAHVEADLRLRARGAGAAAGLPGAADPGAGRARSAGRTRSRPLRRRHGPGRGRAPP